MLIKCICEHQCDTSRLTCSHLMYFDSENNMYPDIRFDTESDNEESEF